MLLKILCFRMMVVMGVHHSNSGSVVVSCTVGNSC